MVTCHCKKINKQNLKITLIWEEMKTCTFNTKCRKFSSICMQKYDFSSAIAFKCWDIELSRGYSFAWGYMFDCYNAAKISRALLMTLQWNVTWFVKIGTWKAFKDVRWRGTRALVDVCPLTLSKVKGSPKLLRSTSIGNLPPFPQWVQWRIQDFP